MLFVLQMLIEGDFRRLYKVNNHAKLLGRAATQHLIKLPLCPGARGRLFLQEVVGMHLKMPRKLHKNRKAQLGVPGFNVTHMSHRYSHLLGQKLLRKSFCLTELPDSFPDFEIIQ